MDGYQYEYRCSKFLKKRGFRHVRVTKGSGDQGIDLIAYKGRKKYGVQCKYYTCPVGNKAVQEAYSGAKFYDCDRSAVLTNNTFTKSARELAGKIGVDLWEYNYIPGSAARFWPVRFAGMVSLFLGLAGLVSFYMADGQKLITPQDVQWIALAVGGCFGILESGKIPLAVISGAAYAFSFSIYEIMEIPSLWKMFQVRGIPLEKLIYLGILAISFLRIAYLWIKKARYEMWKKPKKRKR
ncbi:MAG: restriction endonuclease [Eubacterium sp.]|nr:restriction endonuclease [Eubacterium sp.]